MVYSNSLFSAARVLRRVGCLRWLVGFTRFSTLALAVLAGSPARASSDNTTDRLESWQNVALRWGSGAQSGNASFTEGRVVPLRWVATLKGGSTHTLWIKYDFLIGNEARFFDALASYNATESGVNLALGVTLSGAPTSWPIRPDPAVPAASRPAGSLVAYNVQQVTFGDYTTVNGVRCVPLTIKVAGTSGNKTVVLAYGARLASEAVWGPGKGAVQSPGASGKAYSRLNSASDRSVSINPSALAAYADLQLTLSGPAQGAVGGVLDYTIGILNAGPNSASSVTVTNPLPAGTTLVSATASAGSVSGGTTLLASLGSLAPGATATVQVRLLAGAAAAGTLVNSARVGSATLDPIPGNNAASVSTLVIVPDQTPPVITAPGDLVVPAEPGTCTARVSYEVSAVDDRTPVTLSVVPPSGSLFPLGTTPVLVTATDGAGNVSTKTFLVTVQDREAPTLTCPANLELTSDPGRCGAAPALPSVTATDSCDGSLAVLSDPAPGFEFPVGTTPVTLTAVDQAGNRAQCTYTVTVVDREAPALTCPADLEIEVAPGRCGADVALPSGAAQDACEGAVAVLADHDSGEFPIGATPVTLSAADQAGNRASCSYTVTVRDAPNESWPLARPLVLAADPAVPGLLSAAERQCLVRLDQSRWYRFRVQPGSTLVVTLSELAANYDLAVFKDVAAVYQQLITQTDLVFLSAAFAPAAFSPAAFSPDALSPAAFSPAAFSPAAFSPAAFSPAAFSPAAFSPAAFSPAAFSPDAFAPAAFSPAAFSPAAFSPAAFSPAAFSPAAFSPAAFSDAQAQAVLGVSAFEGTANEGVVINTWDAAGDFYVRVRGRNGAFEPGAPFLVSAYLYPGRCGELKLEATDEAGQPLSSLPADAGGFQTLILTDVARMPDDGTIPAMQAALQALAARPEVNGAIVDLGADPRVAFFHRQADGSADCPTAKNLVAAAIKDVVDRWRSLNPTLSNLVLVGSDAVIPFFRYPDEALLGPERNYVPPVLDRSASQASLRRNYVLAQDAFGAACELPRASSSLPIPGIPVGRLVENPAEVTALVTAYLDTPDGVVATPAAALVTGYDFLTDAAAAVEAELSAGLGAPIDALVTPAHQPPADGWTADDLRAALFGRRHDLVFLAGHFSAFGALAADFTTFIAARELEEAEVDFKNAILVSAGCHSGYSAVDADGVPLITPQPDWAQACARRQATLIAGTGYQYGDTDFLEYSERLYRDFFHLLRSGTGPVPVGQALLQAKARYLATTPVMRGLHEKAYLQATLFGLPMLRVNLPAGRVTEPAGPGAPVIAATTPYPTAPGSVLGLTYADLLVTPQFSPERSLVLDDFENGAQVTARWFEGRDGILNTPAEPILPLEVRNVSQPDTVLRGVGFRSGTYEDLGGFLPLTGAATTEIRGVHVGFPSEVFFPLQPWSLNYFGSICRPEGGATLLNLATAQFRAEVPGNPAGTLRRHTGLGFRLFYSDNLRNYAEEGVDSTPGRSAPPSITSVTAASDAGRVHFLARVTGNPAAGIQEVWVTYTAVQGPLFGTWTSLNLRQNADDSTLWEGDLDLGPDTHPAHVRYMVQAVNGVGLVALNHRQGRYHVPDATDGWADAGDLPTAIALVGPPTQTSFGASITLTARLTAGGQPLEGHGVVFKVADQQATARTGTGASAGLATATLQIATLPGEYEIKATYPGGFGYASSWTAAPLDIAPGQTAIEFEAAATAVTAQTPNPLVARLTVGSGSPIPERTVLFVIGTGDTALYRPVITDYAGQARLGPLGLASGQYPVTAHFAAPVGPLPGSGEILDLTDPRYTPLSATTSISIDADPPVVSQLAVTPEVLRENNHKMVPVTVTVSATDPAGPATSRLVEIRSSEPVNGTGDGDRAPDWEITGPLTANLRAERAQNGPGRTYTLVIETADPLGNRRQDTVTVFVPKNRNDDDEED